jgi:predicted RNA-binding Zn-ribbon protein involved in translation (DUF1610 family)
MSNPDFTRAIVAEVVVHTGEHRASYFVCPNCGTNIRFNNAYPLSFKWKVCPNCRWQWIPADFGAGLGPHADDIAGQTNVIRVAASGRALS